jgi:uncharacterized protein YbjQ (UPF0145 family)
MWPAMVHFGLRPAGRVFRLQRAAGAAEVLHFWRPVRCCIEKSLEVPMPIAAATHTSAVFWFLPLLGLLLIGVVMFRWSRRAKTTTTRRLEEVERELATVQSQILLVTTSAVPGGRTVRTLGYVEALSDTEAASDWEYRLAEKQALLGLARQGLGIGANAIVGVRKSNAHYDQAGSKWRVARVTYAGTAVVVDQRLQSTEWAAS